MTRDKLRALALGTASVRKQIVEFEGASFEVRQPTIRERSELRERSVKGETLDILAFTVWSVIGQTFMPGTDQKVFEATDFDALASLPSGGLVDVLSGAISVLSSVSIDEKKSD